MNANRQKQTPADKALKAQKTTELRGKVLYGFDNARQAKKQEPAQCLGNIEQNLQTLKSNIQSIEISPIIEGQLAKIASASALTDKLDKLMIAFNTTFALNDCIAEHERIEGVPGSLILSSHLIRKAIGENVSALTLQAELKENGINRSENICNMADILANHYIDNNIAFKPEKAPFLSTQPL